MKLVSLSTNKYTSDVNFLVSDEDYDRVSEYKWCVGYNGTSSYRIMRSSTKEEKSLGAGAFVRLHRFILNLHLKHASAYETVDHLNQNIFDNQRSNLKRKSKYGNNRNAKSNTGVGLGLWGASFEKTRKDNVWSSYIYFMKKKIRVGNFLTEQEAHDAAVSKYKELTGKNPVINLEQE